MFIRYPAHSVIVPSEGITEMKRLSIDCQIKSAHNGYRNQTFGIMSI